MARKITGITVEIGGDTTKLDKALRGANKEIRDTQTALKDVERLLKFDPGNTDLLEQRQRLLADAVSETKDKLDLLQTAAKQANSALAAGDINQAQYDTLQREIAETTKNLEDLEDAADKSSVRLGELEAAAGKVSSVAGKVSDISKPFSTMATGILAAAGAAVPATEELRSDLSKLDNAALNSSASVDSARAAWEKFTVVSDEVDSAVEATSNLLQGGFTESQLQQAVENLSGAYLAFPDTLKIESLADSLQETLSTGTATGQFGELLDRLGIGAENFTAQLSQVPGETNKINFAMDTLAHAGMSDLYNSWIDNNQALVDNKQSSLEMQQELANLANTIQPLITDITQLATTFLGWFNSISGPGQKAIFVLIALVAAISPIASLISSVTGAIKGVSTVGTLFSSTAGNTVYLTFAKWSLIIMGVVAAVAALVAMINVLIGKGDEASNVLGGLTGATKTSGAGGSGGGRRSSAQLASVPGFAEGGVFAPNSPMLAILGDNRTETEIAAPQSALEDTFLAALAKGGLLGGRQGGSSRPIYLQLDGRTFARLMGPYMSAETARLGTSLAKG